MYYKRCGVLAGVGVCLALALLSMGQPARAEEPQTVSVTFGLRMYCDAYYQDPPLELSDFVGEDTVAILTGKPIVGFSDGMVFAGDSPPCDGVPVGGTYWQLQGDDVTIVNKGGPISASIYASCLPLPPAKSVLVAKDITAVHACWLKFDTGSGQARAQEVPDGYTQAVFIIVTGEFLAKN